TGLRRGTSQERERRDPGVVADRARILDVVAGVERRVAVSADRVKRLLVVRWPGEDERLAVRSGLNRQARAGEHSIDVLVDALAGPRLILLQRVRGLAFAIRPSAAPRRTLR